LSAQPRDERSEKKVEATAVDSFSINRVSTAEQVANGLRAMIVAGDLRAGTPLREVAIAESVGVSRNTVREALRELARQGVVTHSMHRGVVVSELTEDDVADIFGVRRVVELAAIEASRAATAEEFEELEEAVEAIKDAAAARKWQELVDADLRFHTKLVALLKSQRIATFYQNIQAEVRLCLSIVDRELPDPSPLVAEHRELLDMLLAGKRRRCAEVLRAHLADAEELVKEAMKGSGTTEPGAAAAATNLDDDVGIRDPNGGSTA
jgi:DNA-binding GntR family transcriptional regulator